MYNYRRVQARTFTFQGIVSQKDRLLASPIRKPNLRATFQRGGRGCFLGETNRARKTPIHPFAEEGYPAIHERVDFQAFGTAYVVFWLFKGFGHVPLATLLLSAFPPLSWSRLGSKYFRSWLSFPIPAPPRTGHGRRKTRRRI